MAQRKAKAAGKKPRDPHPAQELARLRASLRDGSPKVAYVLRGEELYFSDQMIAAIQSSAESVGWDICKHDTKDPDFDLSRLLDDLTSGALFAAARCVIVRHGGALLTKGNKLNSAGFLNAAKARVAASEPGCVVIVADKLRADSPFIKAITPIGGEVFGCRKLWDSPPPWDPDPRRTELAQWLLLVARERRIDLSPDDASYVAMATGNDLYALIGQLDKLSRAGGKGVRELVGWDAGGSPYKVAEYVVAGDAPRAVAGLEALYRSGFKGKDGTATLDLGGLGAMLCGALNGKLRETVHGSQALARGVGMSDVARIAGVRGGPSATKDFEARIKRRPPEAWHRMFEEAGELERRSRLGAKVDANDFAHFALRWAVVERRGYR